jgi:hypothetical protein
VYIIRNLDLGRTYVGSSQSVRARLEKHFQDLASGRHHNEPLQQDFRLYGIEAFGVYFLKACPDRLTCETEECVAIAMLGRQGVSLYNLTPDGQGRYLPGYTRAHDVEPVISNPDHRCDAWSKAEAKQEPGSAPPAKYVSQAPKPAGWEHQRAKPRNIEAMIDISGVYIIRHLASGRTYVGSSSTVRFSMEADFRDLAQGGHLNRSLQADHHTYGADAFGVYLFKHCLYVETLATAEQSAIAELERKGMPLYNLAPDAYVHSVNLAGAANGPTAVNSEERAHEQGSAALGPEQGSGILDWFRSRPIVASLLRRTLSRR